PRFDVGAWIATPAVRDPVAALFPVLVHAVDEVGHPADARLEERPAPPRVAVEGAARDERGHRGHLIEWEADAVHLDVVGEAVDAYLREVNARRAVDAERHVELDRRGVERVQIGM